VYKPAGLPGEGISYWPPPEINQNLSRKVGNLGLTDAEEDQIVQFLKTLTDGFKP
jgi:cytochrome c peroxidase